MFEFTLSEFVFIAVLFVFLAYVTMDLNTPINWHTFSKNAITLAGLFVWVGAIVYVVSTSVS